MFFVLWSVELLFPSLGTKCKITEKFVFISENYFQISVPEVHWVSVSCEYYSLKARQKELTSKCIIIIWSLFKILGGDSEEEVEQGNDMTSDDISDTR